MLVSKKNLIKIPSHCTLNFLVHFKTKFLVVNIDSISKNNYFILIPNNIKLIKTGLFIYIDFTSLKKYKNSNLFLNYFKNLINNFRLKSFKQLYLLGLGLKIFLEDSVILMRLGFSHNNNIFNIYDSISNLIITKIGLKGFLITFYGFNKIKLGNLVEKIYKLRPADCYKNRGFSYKTKFNILKTVKKK